MNSFLNERGNQNNETKNKLITLVVAFFAAISLPCHRRSMQQRVIRDLIGQSIREQVDDTAPIKISS
ncbi:hypothetical protein Lpp124_10148, partial [Lacticaseibacillus paracasei subsp. paracasei CNCM I-4649]